MVLVRIEIHLGEGVLHRLFGVLGTLENRPRPPEKRRLIAAHENREKLRLPSRPRKRLGVGEHIEFGG
jgi:hypothetical protein